MWNICVFEEVAVDSCAVVGRHVDEDVAPLRCVVWAGVSAVEFGLGLEIRTLPADVLVGERPACVAVKEGAHRRDDVGGLPDDGRVVCLGFNSVLAHALPLDVVPVELVLVVPKVCC